MSATRTTTSRTQLWLESLGDWAWPGTAAPETPMPPAWVPTVPPRLEYALAGAGGASASAGSQTRATQRRILIAGLLSALLAVCAALALRGSLALEGLLGERTSVTLPEVAAPAAGVSEQPLPPLVAVGTDAAGSEIAKAHFHSAALSGAGAFIVYLPPRYASTAGPYPVLYLLHGRDGHASAFLEVGIQSTLDRLIAAGTIPPMIAVMIQDRSTLQNWQNVGRFHSASYVVEVQQMIDRMLPTIASRAGRAIAGSSMGGFGAMHVALANPTRFSVVESWLGYFNHLQGELSADAPVISQLGLHAFLYGGETDTVASPQQDPAFAEALRAEGAEAESAVYPGGHTLEKIEEHLEAGLIFAGSSLSEMRQRASVEEARARWRPQSAA